jgi:hypothetical protein
MTSIKARVPRPPYAGRHDRDACFHCRLARAAGDAGADQYAACGLRGDGWVRRSLPLLCAELAGYPAAIAGYAVILGPALASRPELTVVLRAGCVAYLIWAALSLWRLPEASRADPVGFDTVLVTTLLNPKAFIFAFTIIPASAEASLASLLPWLGGLALMIGLVVRFQHLHPPCRSCVCKCWNLKNHEKP